MTPFVLRLVLIIFFGYSFIKFVGFDGSREEKFGLSFLLGIGLISLIYFLFIWAVNRVDVKDFWIITSLLTTVLLILKKPRINLRKLKVPRIFVKPGLVVTISWIVIYSLFILSLVNTFYRPVYTSDSITLFDFRSKIMFLSHRLSDIHIIDAWSSYPMFTSMVGLIWRFLGIENPSSFYPVMYLSFILVFYSILREVVGRDRASVGALMMYTTPVTLWQSQLDGLTNLSYTVFLSLSALYLYKIIIGKESPLYLSVISALFLGLSSWTRGAEPLWVVLVFVATYAFLIKRKMLWLIAYYAIFSSIRELWPIYIKKPYTPIATGLKVVADSAIHANLAIVQINPAYPQNQMIYLGFFNSLSYTLKSVLVLLPESLGLVWYLFLVFVGLNVLDHKFSKDQLYFLFVIAGFMAILFFGSLFMVVNFHLRIDVFNDSLSRLLGIVTPLLWFYIMISPTWNKVGRLIHLRVK